ncbi:nickel pincer cofactor biosynthesis protein LarC [Paenibacillus sp. FA6]|uniref:nickel pincer cofactor biosynthesis protein LarC n=1 Tax=Paenibacillus sp. FA6 TaxID=3413029 RepID=UPI003F65C9DE
MSRVLYFDCFAGIAGDMALSALIDLGADIDYIRDHLKLLPFDPFEMHVETVVKQGMSAKKLVLRFEKEADGHSHDHSHDHGHSHDHSHDHGHSHDHSHDHGHSHDHNDDHGHSHDHSHDHGHSHDHNDDHGHSHDHSHDHGHSHDHSHDHGHSQDHVHRKASGIIKDIQQSSLPERVKLRSVRIFQAIAVAEGKIHGMSPEDVHFHEVGAMDSIIDIIGVCLALENLDIDTIESSPVPTGRGRMRMAHGLYPIPAPATLEILKGIPLDDFAVESELTTPTGAGILKALATRFGLLPAAQIERMGYGAGTKDFAHPNVLRVCLIEHDEHSQRETIQVLEAQLDDCTGEMMAFAMERLLEAGALDVFYTSIYMKKNRPGVLVTVLSLPDHVDQCEETLLRETTTFGVRKSEWSRKILDRKWISVDTKYGTIRVKQAWQDQKVIHQGPEYEDAAKAAREHQIPIKWVYDEVSAQLTR